MLRRPAFYTLLPYTTLFRSRWTLEEVHSLPDDGNKYELVRGELVGTPPATPVHDDIVVRLHQILVLYLTGEGLADIVSQRAVVRFHGSEVEPDLMVRAAHAG